MSRLANRRARFLDAKYRQFGEAATWTPAGGGAPLTGVSVRPRGGDDTQNWADSRMNLPTVILEVRRDQVAAPAAGDSVELLDDETLLVLDRFTLIADPQLTPLGLEWTCEARREADAP